MKLDSFGNPLFTSSDLFLLLYQGENLNTEMIVDQSKEVETFKKVSGFSFSEPYNSENSVLEFDKKNQNKWFLPEEYLTFDIKTYCLSKCTNETETQRVIEEYAEFERREMIPLLQWLKFFVDVCTQQNILWGVGRGSSVSSYVLFLLEVHDINSIKYNLNWHDFLR